MSPPPKSITVSALTCVACDSTSANDAMLGESREADPVLAAGAGGETEHRVGAVARPIDDEIVAAAAVEEVRAGAAVEQVAAVAAEQPVVAAQGRAACR